MAELFTLPDANLIPLPDHVRDYDAVFAEPLAAALRIVAQAQLPERVLVIGDGKLGLLAALVIQLSGSHTFLRGRHEKRMDILHPVGVRPDPGGAFPLVVDCSGNADGFRHAVSRCLPQGRLVLKSTFVPDSAVDLARVVVNEISVLGSRCGDLKEAVEWLRKREVFETISRMHATAVPFSHAVEGIALAARPGVLKVLLDNLPS